LSFASFSSQAILLSLLLDHRAMYISRFFSLFTTHTHTHTHTQEELYGVIPEAAHTT
jgi:hypothetical protein